MRPVSSFKVANPGALSEAPTKQIAGYATRTSKDSTHKFRTKAENNQTRNHKGIPGGSD